MAEMIEAGIRPKSSLRTWIFNPFYYLAGGQALALGLAFIVAAGLMGSAANAHLDGVIDIHAGHSGDFREITGLEAPIWLFPVEGLVDWLSMGLILCGMGFLLSRTRFRLLDLFGTQALARVPAILLVAVAFVPGFQTQAMKLATGNLVIVPMEMAAFVVGMFVTILAIIWMVTLMYWGFATPCNVSGGKAIGAFVVALILAEAFSKTAIIGLMFSTQPGFRIW